MNQTKGHSERDEFSINSLAQAVFIVNKHAKTALEPKNLYNLKRLALNKLMQEGKAKKIGLHFSDNPRFAAQQSDVIVECGSYVFHLPPTKEDLKNYPTSAAGQHPYGTLKRRCHYPRPNKSCNLTLDKQVKNNRTLPIPRKGLTGVGRSSNLFTIHSHLPF